MKKRYEKTKVMSGIMVMLALLVFLICSAMVVQAAEIKWSGIETTTFRVGSSPRCNNDNANNPYWIEKKGGEDVQSGSINDCFRENGIDDEGKISKYCCGPQAICVNASTSTQPAWLCKKIGNDFPGPVSGANSCSDLKGKTACDTYGSPTNINFPEKIKNTIEEKYSRIIQDYIIKNKLTYNGNYDFCHKTLYAEGNGKCYKVTNCMCVWNGTSCIESYAVNNKCPGPNPIYTNDDKSCQTTDSPIVNKCDSEDEAERLIIRSWTSKLINKSGAVSPKDEAEEAGCKSGSKEYPCPYEENGSMVNFFGAFGFICAGIVICIIYFIMRKKKVNGH